MRCSKWAASTGAACEVRSGHGRDRAVVAVGDFEVTASSPFSDRTVVILNPKARGGRAAGLLDPMRSWLRERDPSVQLVCPASVPEGFGLVAGLPLGSRVIVVGGDGSLHRLLPAILGGQHRLGVVPFGSGNDFARAHGCVGLDWRFSLELALSGSERRVDTGELRNGDHVVPFLSSLAAGFDAAVGLRALAGPAWLSGLPRYLWATVIQVYGLERYRVRIRTDECWKPEDEVIFASVLNTPTYGGGMRAVPHAQGDDGQLDLIVAGRFSRLGTLLMLPRLLAARHLSHRLVVTRSARSMEFQADRKVPLAADGEGAGSSSSWQVQVRAGSLRLIAGGA